MNLSGPLQTDETMNARAFDAAPIGLILVGSDGCIVKSNGEMSQIVGYAGSELLGLAFAGLIDPPDHGDASDFKTYLATARVGSVYSAESRYRHKNGRECWLNLSSRMIAANDGVSRFAICVVRDVSHRRFEQHRLTESEGKLRLGVAVAGIGVGSIDYTKNVIQLDQTSAALFDLPADVWLPREQVHARFHPDDRAAIFHYMAQCLDPAGDGFMAMEHRIIRSDTSVRWVTARKQISFENHSPGDRRPTTGLLAVLDINDGKRAEEALIASENFSRKLFESSPDCIQVLDTDGNLVTMNENGQNSMEIADFALVEGTPWSRLWPSASRAVVNEAVETALNGQIAHFIGLCPTQKGGERWWDVLVSAVPGPGGVPIRLVATSRDITFQKRDEQQAILLTNEVNHRSKNLLAVVAAVARQTARHDDPKVFAERFSQRLNGLAASQDLLVESRWRGVELQTLIVSQLSHFADLVGSRIQLLGRRLTVSAAAAQSLGMAIHELATNAGKYGALSNAAGTVAVTWSIDTIADEEMITLTWVERAGPECAEPTRKGFGHTVVGAMIEHALDAEVTLSYPPEGVVWQARAKASNVAEAV